MARAHRFSFRESGPHRGPLAVSLVVCSLSLFGCGSSLPAYVAKQGFRQGGILLRARPVDEILEQSNLDPATETSLRLSREVVRYAHDKLGMRTGRNYQNYVDLGRPWVTQVVTAARRDKLEQYLFRYPILGDLPYKGFFDEADAVDLENALRAQGFDTYRRKVEAFSTAGWLPDPLTSSMIGSPGRLIELLFHELTHSTFYFKSYADFNEAFASWMGFNAALEFVAAKPKALGDAKAIRAQLTRDNEFQMIFAKAVRDMLKRGDEIYGRNAATTLEEKRGEYFAWVRARIESDPRLKRRGNVEWNNALILSLGTYYELVGPIDAYARRHNLTPRAFLALVTRKGPAIVDEILGVRSLASPPVNSP